MRRPVAAGCLAGLLLASPSLAAAADLLSLYREARSRDPAYLAARHGFAAAEQKLPQARAALLPTVSIGGGGSQQRGTASFNDGPFADRTVTSRNWSLQITQPLFRPASWFAYNQAGAQVRQAAAQLAQAGQELILRLAQAYFDVVLAGESIAVATAQHAAVEQQWNLARRNFDVGTATITDVHEAKSRLDLARAQKIAAANELTVRQAELERIVGPSPATLPGLAPDLALPAPEPAAVQAWVDLAAAGSPQLAIQGANVEALEHDVARSRGGHAPSLDLNASYGHSYASGSITSPEDIPTRHRSGQLGVQLSIPLWSGGATAARVAEAEANLDKGRADLEAARRQAVAAARQAFAGVTGGLAQVEALGSALVSSQDAVEANRVGYRIGTRINIDVLNAEQQLYATRRDLARARIETVMHGLRLKAAVGALGESDIIAVNGMLKDTP